MLKTEKDVKNEHQNTRCCLKNININIIILYIITHYYYYTYIITQYYT